MKTWLSLCACLVLAPAVGFAQTGELLSTCESHSYTTATQPTLSTSILPLNVRGEMDVTSEIDRLDPEYREFLIRRGSSIEERDGVIIFGFPMVNAKVYLRDEGRILMMAEVDSTGKADLILSSRLVDPEVVVATSMGTELESFPLGALEEIDERAALGTALL